MIRNALLVSLFTLFAGALGGCHLYIDDESEGETSSYCDQTGCYECDDWGCYPVTGGGGVEPGWDCSNNFDCAAGCFCNSTGVCEEAGFCASDNDCPSDYVCDDRSSCIPEGSNAACTSDEACPSGSYCDEGSGVCVGSWTCNDDLSSADLNCGMGFECDERNTCVPATCTDDGMCQEGCYCDEGAGECIETALCDPTGSCAGDLVCDVSRNTCVPADEVGPTCQGDVDCALAAPVCPTGSTPIIENGCFTGSCMVKADCPDGAPFACSDLGGDENACTANAICGPVYRGVDCTAPNGDACTSGSSNCTCESFIFDSCEEA